MAKGCIDHYVSARLHIAALHPGQRLTPAMHCRAAQRRFRERQKNLIQELKDRETALAKQCEEQKRLIEQLQKENQVLKEIMHAKDSK